MNKKIIIVILLLISVGLYIMLQNSSAPEVKSRTFSDLIDRELAQIKITKMEAEGQEPNALLESKTPLESKTLNVEIVNTPQSTAQGLSGREEIGSDGMLFIFPAKDIRYFWMKDMNFDLDLVWIAGDKVVEISRSAPKPAENTPDYRLETYSAQSEINMVLELKAGEAQINEINPGDVVQLVE